MTDLSECVVVAIPRRYVDPWLATDHFTAEEYDRWAAERPHPADAIETAAKAGILRAVENPLRVLGDDEVVVSREAAYWWWDGWLSPPPDFPRANRALYDELTPQLAPPRPPVEVGQVRLSPRTEEHHEVTAVGRRYSLLVRHDGYEVSLLTATVESWELVEEGTDQ